MAAYDLLWLDIACRSFEYIFSFYVRECKVNRIHCLISTAAACFDLTISTTITMSAPSMNADETSTVLSTANSTDHSDFETPTDHKSV
jgi:hypothetical protein